ncbi:C40 family peptidase [Leuconostoc gelidum subsp. gasicomitatum]|uniref:peptidoglycan amidohydrolase family protein n=1 Tax=Leuconostoc gasicomitatum TaxID=115778 RepID=UPI001CC4616A|nr:peptidoglycan amidohydrolase family protein [Leuconostoc gasicomitatum]MBZ5995342.1 C40 family peptidase [Leuconostoc gasicomitatum]
MGYDVNTAIATAKSYIGRVTYTMDWWGRDGNDIGGTLGFDCSAFVYHVLEQAGAWNGDYLKRSHYTGTLKHDLEAAGFKEVDGDHVSRGDVFVWGDNYGSGAGGVSHTGLFYDDGINIIDSSWYTAGAINGAINIHDHNEYWALDNQPEYHFFHYFGGGQSVTPSKTSNVKPSAPDQDLEKGSVVKIPGTFILDDLVQYQGSWYAVNDSLAVQPVDYNNYIPVKPLTETDKNSIATKDQDFSNAGVSYFTFAGKEFTVTDVDADTDSVCVTVAGEPVWLKAGPMTEVRNG